MQNNTKKDECVRHLVGRQMSEYEKEREIRPNAIEMSDIEISFELGGARCSYKGAYCCSIAPDELAAIRDSSQDIDEVVGKLKYKCAAKLAEGDNAAPGTGGAAKTEAIKQDSGKPDWTLFPYKGAEVVVRVLEYGAKKYTRDNWKANVGGDPVLVKEWLDRLLAAAARHLHAHLEGDEVDAESGLPHIAHAACDLLMFLWYAAKEKK